MRAWVGAGDHIRSEVDDDLILIRGLRRLLPSYRGPPRTFYRGESVYNWKRRTYGLSWSGQVDVARGFAESSYVGSYRYFEGGSVLVKVVARSHNMICAVTDDHYVEEEYLLDRRGLKGVTAVQRYQQLQIAPTS